jgi:hypothetical protein
VAQGEDPKFKPQYLKKQKVLKPMYVVSFVVLVTVDPDC